MHRLLETSVGKEGGEMTILKVIIPKGEMPKSCVAEDYGIIEVKEWDGKFYFEREEEK
jgi:hypothetical protein